MDTVIPGWPYCPSALEHVMNRIPVPAFSPITPHQAQAKIKQAQSPDEITQVVYKYALDHGLMANLDDRAIFEKLDRWRIGA